MLTDSKQNLSSFCGHINDWLIGSPLTNKSSGHNRPVFPRISHFRCENSCEIARFTMAVVFGRLMLNSKSLRINIGNHRKSSVNVGNLRANFGGLRKSSEIFLQFPFLGMEEKKNLQISDLQRLASLPYMR